MARLMITSGPEAVAPQAPSPAPAPARGGGSSRRWVVLLATHGWLTATSVRVRHAAAAGSALLAGFAYATQSRRLVMLAGHAAVGAFMFWRRPSARGSVAAAGLTALAVAAAGWAEAGGIADPHGRPPVPASMSVDRPRIGG